MKKYLLSLLAIAGILVITCGNEPPEGFYEGTPEDSAAILALLDENPELLQTIDLFNSSSNPLPYTAIDLDQIGFIIEDSVFLGDSVLIKQHVDSCRLSFSDTSRFVDLWFARDTTCTVYLIDTFNLIADMHFDQVQKGYYFWFDDSVWIDTVVVIDTVDYFTKNMSATGDRHIFFEPVRDQVVNEEGDTVWAIRDPKEWVLKRISYGTYYYPDAGADNPYIVNVVLTPSAAAPETVYFSAPDTLFHHAMDRLIHIDSLLVFTAGETLDVDVTLRADFSADTLSTFVSCAGQNRVELPNASGSVVLEGSGIVNLYIEVIQPDSYFYVVPDKGYVATVLLIPIRIQ